MATSTCIRFGTFLFVFAFRPHSNGYSAFSKVSVFTENGDFQKRVRKWRLSKTETFENAALSCGWAKTETFENGVDLKTHVRVDMAYISLSHITSHMCKKQKFVTVLITPFSYLGYNIPCNLFKSP